MVPMPLGLFAGRGQSEWIQRSGQGPIVNCQIQGDEAYFIAEQQIKRDLAKNTKIKNPSLTLSWRPILGTRTGGHVVKSEQGQTQPRNEGETLIFFFVCLFAPRITLGYLSFSLFLFFLLFFFRIIIPHPLTNLAPHPLPHSTQPPHVGHHYSLTPRPPLYNLLLAAPLSFYHPTQRPLPLFFFAESTPSKRKAESLIHHLHSICTNTHTHSPLFHPLL